MYFKNFRTWTQTQTNLGVWSVRTHLLFFYQIKGFAFDRVQLDDDEDEDEEEEAEDHAEDDIREEMDVENENQDVPITVTYITAYKI